MIPALAFNQLINFLLNGTLALRTFPECVGDIIVAKTQPELSAYRFKSTFSSACLNVNPSPPPGPPMPIPAHNIVNLHPKRFRAETVKCKTANCM
ncbi:hypothetical protein ACTXT7_014257 [Hymenolepis weldensis]